MKKPRLINIAAISALVLVAGAGTALASANNISANVFNRGNRQNSGVAVNSQFHTQMETAIENGDYAAWKELMGDRGGAMTDVINADNFAQFAQAWKLDQSGDHTGAQAIYDELGLNIPGRMMGGRHGFGNGDCPGMDQDTRDKIDAAISNGDYAAWKELMGDRGRVTEVITADNFAQFAQAWKLDQSGDHAGAQAIRQELGLGKPEGLGNGFHGRGRGNQNQQSQ